MAANLKFRGRTTIPPVIDSYSNNTKSLAFLILPKCLAFGIVALTALACYINSLNYDLVHDDIFAIKDNMDIRPKTPVFQIFSNDFWGKPMSSNRSHKSYRPICTLTFRMNFAIHELRPFGYHLVNIILHCLVCVVYTYLCEEIVFKSTILAVIAGLLFAAHPVHTEAVTGVVGRADVLACLLFLFSFLAFVRSADNKVHCFKKCIYTSVCLMFGSMAMLVKEHGLTVFGVCIIYDCLVINKKFIWRMLRPSERTFEIIKPVFIRMFILSAVVISLLGFRLWMLGGNLPYFTKQDNPASFSDSFSTRVMTYCYLFTFNSWLLLSPSVLSYDWQMDSIPLVESLLDSRNLSTIFFFVLVVLLASCAVFSKRVHQREQDILVLSLALTCVPFLPASNIFFRVGFVVAERILYIPSMGFCMLTVHGLNKLTSLGGESKQLYKGFVSYWRITNGPRMALLSGAVLLIALFCWKTVVRNNVWSSRESLFRSGVETLPHNAKAHYNYANFLKDVGREKEAIPHYRTALQLAPDHVSAHNNLGTLLNNDEEAMKHFTEAIKYDPYHANAYFNLGSRFASLKRLSEAESMLRQAVRLNPTYMDAVMNLAGVLSNTEKYSEAEELYKNALTLNPNDADAYNNYAVFLGKQGRIQESLANYNIALKLNPSHSVSLVNMARQLRGAGNIREAEQAYKRALSIKREASTLQLLGVMYYHSERLKEAEQAWREALELEPLNIETRSNQAILFSRTNRYSKAVEILKDLVLDDPLNPGHIKTLAVLYAQNGQVKEGLQVIACGLRFHSNDADLYFHQGNLYKDLKDMEEAKKSFLKAVELNPNYFSAHSNLGVIFHLEGNYVDARRHYEIAAKLDPNNVTLKQNMAKLIRVEVKGE